MRVAITSIVTAERSPIAAYKVSSSPIVSAPPTDIFSPSDIENMSVAKVRSPLRLPIVATVEAREVEVGRLLKSPRSSSGVAWISTR